MRLAPLLDRWPAAPSFSQVLAALEEGGTEVVVPDVARAFLLAGVSVHAGRSGLIQAGGSTLPPAPPQEQARAGGSSPTLVVAVTATSADAESLAEDVAAFLGPERVAVFPAWETLPHEPLSPRSETVARRLALIHRLARQAAGAAPETPEHLPLALLAVPARAVMQPLAPGLDRIEPVRVAKGDQLDLEDLLERLVAAGYERTDMVERRGEVAVRGGLVDFFPPGDDHPVRVEFWGDEVEGIRSFAVASQRSLAELPAAIAFPCREVRLTSAERQRARQLAGEFPAAGELLTRVAEGLAVEGLESLLPLLFDELRLLPDYLPDGAVLALVDPKRTLDRAEEVRVQAEEAAQASWTAAAEGGRAPVEGAGYRPLADVLDGSGRPVLRVGPFEGGGSRAVRIDAHAVEPYRANITRVAADARALAADGYTVLLSTEGAGPAERLRDVLRDEGLPVPLAAEPPEAGVAVGTAALLNGFRLPELRLALVAEGDLYGTRRQTREQARMPATRRRDKHAGGAVALEELQPGDIVVHAVHGIARYVGMEHRTVGGAERDYLLLAYDQGDRLYLPSEQVQMISRYVGGESPKLSRLGSREWDRQKARVRRKVREMAAELVRLYSARMASPGHAFGPDSPWQRELEDAFPFAETPDQLAAVEQIKADMEAPVPMDRLLCGDVGYGKTEVAVRAAFKTVMDGKQAAVLVPTTLLAQQHLATFSERFAPFPVKVGVLSRFASHQEQEEVVAAMAHGTMDVVIGTHRLLSADAKWADLGLVVVDEEHRFGVAHKEHLKQLRTEVDVLTLTATPIPRTMEMAISGIRDMSVMETPPEERHPVLTFVGPYDEATVANAIRREMLREGQTFFVHNRVDTIARVAARIRQLVPEARVGVAHGQMSEDQLERIMLDFWDKAYDVLVCTTIIESGIDIPTANTLVVDRADTLGLAQLYQLRGRVGRARERAYAYLMYPPERSITEASHQRLAAIATHQDLGSGMAIAMKDLEIRGAGNLLGADQSGHVALVGYDLYMQMLAEAVAEMRGRPLEQPKELKLEVPIDAHLPVDYVPRERLRLEAYRRLGGAISVDAVAALGAELADRYGPPPPPVRSLLALAGVRAQATAVGLEEVVCFGGRVRLAPVRELAESKRVRLDRLYPGAVWKATEQTLVVPLPDGAFLPAWLSELLRGVLGAPEAPALPEEARPEPRPAAS
ncbi:MAG TPA: transcription-repair coupling factor [Actinomycetota bacterium]|nr:transcription-repair coupling factor [Actinomycetota bacterium]